MTSSSHFLEIASQIVIVLGVIAFFFYVDYRAERRKDAQMEALKKIAYGDSAQHPEEKQPADGQTSSR